MENSNQTVPVNVGCMRFVIDIVLFSCAFTIIAGLVLAVVFFMA